MKMLNCPSITSDETSDVIPESRGLLRILRFSQFTMPEIHTCISIDVDSIVTPLRLYHFDRFSNSHKLIFYHALINVEYYSDMDQISYDPNLKQFVVDHERKTIKHYSPRNDLYGIVNSKEIDMLHNYPNILAGMIGVNFIYNTQYYNETVDRTINLIEAYKVILKNAHKPVGTYVFLRDLKNN